MPSEAATAANAEVTTLLGKGFAWLKDHVVTALGTLALGLGAIVWSKPNIFVGLLAAAVMTASLLYAVAYMRLHVGAVKCEEEARAEVERLRLANLMGQRALSMHEESIYLILLAWLGDAASVRALDAAMPRNNLVKHAVNALSQGRGSLANAKGIHQMLAMAQDERKKLEEQIGPDRVYQKLTIEFTTGGNRSVATGEQSP